MLNERSRKAESKVEVAQDQAMKNGGETADGYEGFLEVIKMF